MSVDKGPPDIVVGSGVYLRCATYDLAAQPPVLFDPASGVAYSLRDPLGALRADEVPMSNEGAGLWVAHFQTADADPIGAWTWACKSTDGTKIDKAFGAVAFITHADTIF